MCCHQIRVLDSQVQTWNQCHEMLLTSHVRTEPMSVPVAAALSRDLSDNGARIAQDKPQSVLLMDTETGSTMSELSICRRAPKSVFRGLSTATDSSVFGLVRQQKNWKLNVDSITPMQKFEQYKQSQE